jgi:hypothetical protein
MSIQPHRTLPAPGGASSGNLADILERVLDKGVVIAGDIVINLLDIELLTIKLRLLIASVDTAKEMGIDWWQNDPFLTGGSNREVEEGGGGKPPKELSERLDRIESALSALAARDEQRELP